MNIKENFFSLTKEQESTSKMIYEGKIIKCLVAPYHTYETLEKIVPFTKTTYLLPERSMTVPQLKGFISMIVHNPSKDESRIITTNQNIIMDMVDDCVRVLTEDGKIVPSPVKTFMANIHDIRYSLLENEIHQKTKAEKSEAHKKVAELIDRIEKGKSFNAKEYNALLKEINLVGEEVISYRLKEMLNQKKSKN